MRLIKANRRQAAEYLAAYRQLKNKWSADDAYERGINYGLYLAHKSAATNIQNLIDIYS